LHAAKITCVWRYETIGTRKKRRFCVLTARKPDRTESKKDMSCEVDRETLALLTQSGFKYIRHGKHAGRNAELFAAVVPEDRHWL
jgi:hypothetical protein